MKLFAISLISIFIRSSLVASFDSNHPLKNWQSICFILSCKSVLEKCIQNECFGVNECRNCVQSLNQICLRCVDNILNEQFNSANGEPVIVCDPINSLHETTCSFYCRMKEKESSKCEQIEGLPVCKCYEKTIITSTTEPDTTAISSTTPTTNTDQTGSLASK
jgi:hypothetical protein